MGKFDQILKFLKTIEPGAIKAGKVSAEDVLKQIDSPELATKLMGADKQKYLEALDATQGDRATRAKDMGFDLSKTQYHGTEHKDSQIDAFRPSGTKKGDTYKYGEGVYTTPWSGYADQYAGHGEGAIYPVHLKEKANFHPGDEAKARELLQNAGIEPQGKGRLRSVEEGLDLIEQNLGKKNVSSFLDANDYRVGLEDDGIFVSKPSDVRSTSAAFDKRFAKSPLLLAGASAAPIDQVSPIGPLKSAATAYNNVKNKIADTLANQMDFSPDKSQKGFISGALSMALDPVNLIPGAAGLGAGALQMMADEEPKNNFSEIEEYLKNNR